MGFSRIHLQYKNSTPVPDKNEVGAEGDVGLVEPPPQAINWAEEN